MKLVAQKILTVGLFCLLVVSCIPANELEPAIVDGTIRFNDDPEFGATRCSIVNTLGEELFVRQCDRMLVLARSVLSEPPTGLTFEENNRDELTPYKVETDFRVVDTRNGTPAGTLLFATDGNGVRTLFWVADDSFPPVGDIPVTGGVVGYSRVDQTVTSPLLLGNGARVADPGDLGVSATLQVLTDNDVVITVPSGREGLFLPCDYDRTIIDVDNRGEPVLGCDPIAR